MYFWSLELFCFLPSITFVLRNRCSKYTEGAQWLEYATAGIGIRTRIFLSFFFSKRRENISNFKLFQIRVHRGIRRIRSHCSAVERHLLLSLCTKNHTSAKDNKLNALIPMLPWSCFFFIIITNRHSQAYRNLTNKYLALILVFWWCVFFFPRNDGFI